MVEKAKLPKVSEPKLGYQDKPSTKPVKPLAKPGKAPPVAPPPKALGMPYKPPTERVDVLVVHPFFNHLGRKTIVGTVESLPPALARMVLDTGVATHVAP